MNKKALLGTLGKIILIFIVVIMLATYFNLSFGTLTKSVKSALGFDKDIIPIDYTQLNNQAKTTFERTIEDIEKCRNSKDTNCKCHIDLSGYSQTHALFFENGQIKLLNIKNLEGNIIKKIREGQSTTIKNFTIGDINCFFKSLDSKEDFDIIYFYQDKDPVIWKERFYTSLTNLGSGYEIPDDYKMYKTNNGLCWLTAKVDESELNAKKICS